MLGYGTYMKILSDIVAELLCLECELTGVKLLHDKRCGMELLRDVMFCPTCHTQMCSAVPRYVDVGKW